MKAEIKKFVSRPGINKSGLCREAGMSLQHLNRVLRGSDKLTDRIRDKLVPVLNLYGFTAPLNELDLIRQVEAAGLDVKKSKKTVYTRVGAEIPICAMDLHRNFGYAIQTEI